jgi:dTMP kinase
MEWCKRPEVGLLSPDVIVHLSLDPEQAAKRGGFGGER